jgi:hypothetical protein
MGCDIRPVGGINQWSGADGKLEHKPAFRVVRGVTRELGDPFETIANGARAEVERSRSGGKVAGRRNVSLKSLDERQRSTASALKWDEHSCDELAELTNVGGQHAIGQELAVVGDRTETVEAFGEVQGLVGFTVGADHATWPAGWFADAESP